MNSEFQDFIHERAENLAVVYLTRRQDLKIERMATDAGLDLLVTILIEGFPTGRVFGVQVKGRDKAFQDTQTLSDDLGINTHLFQDLPFPLCVFLFTMENDQGYYRWMKYPKFGVDNPTSHKVSQEWRNLNEGAVTKIIDDVNSWYELKQNSAA